MNKWLQANKRFLIMNEVLTSRLAIRDFFMKMMVREVYENIGQVLSLVRMQLGVAEARCTDEISESIQTSGELVGQSIRDLRAMSRNFFPDEDIVKEGGFVGTFKSMIAILFANNAATIEMKGEINGIEDELKLLIFNMLQDVAVLIKETGGIFKSLEIYFLKAEIKCTLSYFGDTIKWTAGDDSYPTADPKLQERARLINGKLLLTKNKAGVNQIKLTTPFKIFRDVSQRRNSIGG